VNGKLLASAALPLKRGRPVLTFENWLVGQSACGHKENNFSLESNSCSLSRLHQLVQTEHAPRTKEQWRGPRAGCTSCTGCIDRPPCIATADRSDTLWPPVLAAGCRFHYSLATGMASTAENWESGLKSKKIGNYFSCLVFRSFTPWRKISF
jgi:hypothetical protein